MHDSHSRPEQPGLQFEWSMFFGVASSILVGQAIVALVYRQWSNGLALLALGALGTLLSLRLFRRRERRHIAATQAWFDEEVSRRRATSQQLVENEEWQP